MTKPLRADAERNRRRILDAARELFAARGLSVGLDEIATHAGVGVGTAYRRFPCKGDLIEALFDERVAALLAAAEAGLAEQDPWEGLVIWMTQAVELHATDLSVKEMVFGAAGGEERVTAVRERLAPLVYEIVDRAHASGQLRPDVVATDLPLLQFMVASLSQFDAPGLELWRRALAVVLDGLRAGSTAPIPGRGLTDEEFGRAIANPAGAVHRR
jgi:AcrR family transcriptional regulator